MNENSATMISKWTRRVFPGQLRALLSATILISAFTLLCALSTPAEPSWNSWRHPHAANARKILEESRFQVQGAKAYLLFSSGGWADGGQIFAIEAGKNIAIFLAGIGEPEVHEMPLSEKKILAAKKYLQQVAEAGEKVQAGSHKAFDALNFNFWILEKSTHGWVAEKHLKFFHPSTFAGLKGAEADPVLLGQDELLSAFSSLKTEVSVPAPNSSQPPKIPPPAKTK